MLPTTTADNPMDLRLAEANLPSQGRLRDAASRVTLPNRSHRFLAQLCLAMLLAFCASALGDPISNVELMGSQKQMGQVAAVANVAPVADNQAAWNWAVSSLPHNAMDSLRAGDHGNPNEAVTIFVDAPGPANAAVRIRLTAVVLQPNADRHLHCFAVARVRAELTPSATRLVRPDGEGGSAVFAVAKYRAIFARHSDPLLQGQGSGPQRRFNVGAARLFT